MTQHWPLRTILTAVLVLFVCQGASALLAQTTSLTGVVTDPQGAVIPGIEITLTNQDTQRRRTAITDDQGNYLFSQVTPGTYELRAELTGFKTTIMPDVVLQVDTPATVNIRLELGDISEIVTVTESTEQFLNTVDSSLGNAISGEQIVTLPLNTRNVVDLLSAQPAVTQTGEVAGARRDQSNLTLDGIDVNDQQQGTAFQPVLRVTPDSVQEFKVTVSNPDASFGRSAGAQVSLITRSGTNNWHGSLYHFHRNTVTAANNFFNNRSGIERPALLRNLFGGSLGGPIVKDKAFFFFNYEGRRDRSQESDVRTVPLAHLGDGIIFYNDVNGNFVSAGPDEIAALYPETGGVNPAALLAMADAAARFPANDDGVGDQVNIGGFRFNGSTPLNENTYIAKLDFNLTDDQSLSVRGNYQWDNQGFLSQFPGTPQPSLWSHPTGLATAHTWSVTPTFINTFRYGITRQAFSSQGDSAENAIAFRFIYFPRLFSRTLNRTTPVHNFTNDTSWIKGAHTFQFGTNIRLISNQRGSFSNSFDSAIMNPSFYAQSGGVLDNPDVSSGDRDVWRNALTTLLGRYSQFTGRFIFDIDGSLLASGSPTVRDFSTDEFEFYFEDTWQATPELTFNLGLRWGVNTPVAEVNGFQVQPDVPLGTFFDQRVAGAETGNPVNDPITFTLAGPFWGEDGYYPTDWNNFMPRVSAAWSPRFDNGFLKTIFGDSGQSVLRGGFAMMYDRIGSALAVAFDLNNQLGFVSQQMVAANTFDLSTNLGPLFTGFDQAIRPLLSPAGLAVPTELVFPLQHPLDEAQRIEDSLDENLDTPVNYSWNLSFGREFGHGLFIETAYIGRLGRELMANRDVMHLNNFVDPASGMSWYEAARELAGHRLADSPVDQVPDIPFFENLFANVPTSGIWWADPSLTATQNVFCLVARDCIDILDWTFIQLILDDAGALPNMFFHPQYGALNVLSTVAESDYHGFTLTVRERFRDSLTFDVNYTWSKSFDFASGGGMDGIGDSGGGFADILNPLTPEATRSVSDFDIQHIINSNWLWNLPVGRGRTYLSDASGVADAILGGWSLNGVLRYNSGLAQNGPFEASRWATNWNLSSNAIRIRDPQPDINKGVDGNPPNFWSDQLFAYQSFRDAFAGEVGDRNVFRGQSFFTLDFGLYKGFTMPYNEGHKLTFRWEVFNATNTQRLGAWTGNRSSFGTAPDPQIGTPSASFGNITSIQGRPREMQFGLRYDF